MQVLSLLKEEAVNYITLSIRISMQTACKLSVFPN